MSFVLQRGDKVRFQHDDSWASPGCVISQRKDRLLVYWPDDDVLTCENPANLVPYRTVVASQSCAA